VSGHAPALLQTRGVMMRVAAALVLALVIVGCGSAGDPDQNGPVGSPIPSGPSDHPVPSGPSDHPVQRSDPVQLVTGFPTMIGDNGGCFTDSAAGPLLVDPKYGTAIIDTDVHSTGPVPVAWRLGFTGRRVGSEIEVLDPKGNVVATTGHMYRIAGGYVSPVTFPNLPANGMFWACDFVIPQP
jgi:hypothetical protein